VIRLVALDQDTGTQTTLDLEGTPSISLNLAVAKPGETMQRHAPYSQTFRLPFTDRNNVFFSHFYEVTLSDGDFDPTQKTEVLIFEDGVQVIRGAMQLRAVRLMGQTYEVNVLGDVADLFAEMGSKLLQAAFLDGSTYTTDYNYNSTAANVIASQDLNQSISIGDQVPDGTIIIPFADHGLTTNNQPLTAQFGYGLRNPDSSVNGLFAEMLKPSMKLRVLVDLIIRTNGFTYSSDFIGSDLFGSLYMTLGTETERVPASAAGQFLANKPSNQASITDPSLWVGVSFPDDTAPLGFDNDGNYNNGTSVYTAAQGGVHRFHVKMVVRASFATVGTEFNVIGRLSSGNISLGSRTVTMVEGSSPVTGGDQRTLEWQVETLLTAGDGVQVEVRFPNGAAGDSIQVLGNTLGADPAPIFFKCNYAPGGQVNIPQALPRIKQKDLMRDLCQRFNLVIEADPDNPKKLYIEPYNDWIADGGESYWTDKLDMDKERTLMPTSSLKSSRILFEDKESSDVGNAYIKETQGQTFGAYDQDIDDDFATGELKNAPVFAPYFVYPVPTLAGDPITINNFFLIHRSYQRDGVGVKPTSQPPKLFFATGTQDIQDTYYIDNTGFSSFLFCSPLSESPLDDNTQTTYWNSTSTPFSMDQEIMAGADVPAIGLHQEYWAAYLADIYDADARMFEAFLYLTPSDIRNVRFNDRFHILGATYKLTEISNYQIGTGEPTLCKFLRDLSRSSFGACSSIPTQSNANGTVTFTDADGTTTVDPGQQCCESFGYFYDASTNTCRWLQPGNDTGNPGPPDTPTDAQDPEPYLNGDNPGPVSPTGTNTNTTDPDSGTVSVYDEVILTGETTDDGQVTPSAPNGVPIQVADNTVAVGVVRITSVTVGGTSGVPYTTKFETWRFLANGNAETVTVSETSGTELDYGSPGLRRLTASMADGILSFQVAGEADEIINWTLSVEMVRMYANNISAAANAILTEAGANLTTEGGNILIQE
jgi:hypothetical protein